jgi:hypothetical protein
MEKRIINLTKKICKEHFEMTNGDDCKNLNYLWYMYVHGTKKNTFKPFVFLAELSLLHYLKYIDKKSTNNVISMLESTDKENLFVASQVIQFYRKERIKELGEFNIKEPKYVEVRKSYETKILNKDIWSNKKKLENNE